jgi:hypothetical protein
MPTKPFPLRAGGGQVSGGLEGEGVPLADLVGVEQATVLGGDDLEAVVLADLGEDAFGVAQLGTLSGDDGVLEPRALGEEQDLLGAPLIRGEKAVHRARAEHGGAGG